MPSRFVEMWRWQGTIDGKTYAIAGCTAFLLKFLLDKFVAFAVFGRPWFLWSYWQPLGPDVRVNAIHPDTQVFAGTLLVLALPFIWLGVTLTVQRLRDAGKPLWLVVFFFVPVINLLFFLLLCIMGSHSAPAQREAAPWPETRMLDRWIPRSTLGAAAASIGITIAIGSMFTVLGTEVLRSYGWGLFVALPFCLGLFSVLVYGYHEPRSYSSCMAVSLVPIALLGAVLLLVMIEGLICILMAAPFALALSAFGGMLGYTIQAGYWLHKGTPAMLSIVFLFTPAFQSAEHWAKLQPEKYEVRTAIEVNAPPEKVWNQVVAFAEIPPPKELLFRAGIAYPIRAEISGHGVGAVRHCVFFDRAVCGTDRSVGRTAIVEVRRNGESGSVERAQPLRKYSAAAFARVLCFQTRTILADGAARRADAPRKHDVVSAHHVARHVLAFVVGLHHSSDSP